MNQLKDERHVEWSGVALDAPTKAVLQQLMAAHPWTCELSPSLSAPGLLLHDTEVSWVLLTRDIVARGN